MKKILILLVVFSTILLGVEVNAACAFGANVGGESVCLTAGATAGNSNGTAYPEGSTLVLENYNGGNIQYTSGLGNTASPVKIKLIGDNYITAEESFGISTSITGVTFIGDGTLTIKSKLPLATVNFDSQNRNVTLSDTVTTVKILAGNSVVEKEETTEVEDTTTIEEKNTVEKDKTLPLVIICCAVSVICVVITLITSVVKKK